MKKCPDCSREIDRMAVICEYCGRLEQKKIIKNTPSIKNNNKESSQPIKTQK